MYANPRASVLQQARGFDDGAASPVTRNSHRVPVSFEQAHNRGCEASRGRADTPARPLVAMAASRAARSVAPVPVILTAACQRTNRLALPLPDHLRCGAAQKVVRSLLAKGTARGGRPGPGDPVWRENDESQGVTLVATGAVLEALGMEPASKPTGDSAAATAPRESPGSGALCEAPAGRTARRTGRVREGPKQAQLVTVLKRAESATIAEWLATAHGPANRQVHHRRFVPPLAKPGARR
jgi:hypothetical protein